MDGVEVAMTQAEELWAIGAAAVRAELKDATWNAWFREVRAVSFDGEVLTLSVPSGVAREKLRSNYTGLLTSLLQEATGEEIEVELIVSTPDRIEQSIVIDETLSLHYEDQTSPSVRGNPLGESLNRSQRTSSFQRVPSDQGERGEDQAQWASLNPRYTFEHFVIGASNRFAHAAALSVAENPARSYNPLFIYGPAGLGKTHLLHAIGNYVRDVHKLQRVRYVSTETLMNEFVDSIRSNTSNAFRRRYREVEVLLVDDIQFLERSQQLQEEFFHTFNSLHAAGNQIVISSDRPPKQIPRLEDRLRTRLEWGLITDVSPPEFETRLAILRMKAESENLAGIPSEVLDFIASNISDNVRELEGALIRVAAYSSLNRSPLTEEIAKQVLHDILPPTKPRVITPALILDETAKMFGFPVEDLCGRSRRRPLVMARQIGMYVFREMTDYSYPRIAEEFGGRDHTTVIHAVEKIKGLLTERHTVFDQVNELMGRIRLGTGG
ncbi:MAG: chromosomal replication initiator protein DnaA [Actinobacteria bacterium]|nr:chromosomal replication initiator protein DnaA [Actinomycetota bacterium]